MMLNAQALVTLLKRNGHMIREESFIKAWENRRLVGGAIKAAGVRRDYQDYADLFQDGVLIYAGMIEESPGQDVDKLAFKKILWHTLDELRKIKRLEEKNQEIETNQDFAKAEVDWDSLVVLKDEVKKLNRLERLLFFEHLLAQREISGLVERAGCSRRTLQRVKKDLLLKLRKSL